jgi:hypothetical protein
MRRSLLGNPPHMANVLEATVDAARHGVETVGEQVSSLASKVTELVEPQPKRSGARWWWAVLVVVLVALGWEWWRRRATDTLDAERTDATGVPRQPMRSSA